VLAISIGQILFKKTGLLVALHDSWLHSHVILTLGIAGVIYGSATILWIYLLKDAPLSKAYMLTAVSFIAVPIASIFMFNESVNFTFYLGATIIITGIIIILKFS